MKLSEINNVAARTLATVVIVAAVLWAPAASAQTELEEERDALRAEKARLQLELDKLREKCGRRAQAPAPEATTGTTATPAPMCAEGEQEWEPFVRRGFNRERSQLQVGLLAAMFEGDQRFNVDAKRENIEEDAATDFKEQRLELWLEYGLLDSLTAGLMIPYLSREIQFHDLTVNIADGSVAQIRRKDLQADGIGDMKMYLRFALSPYYDADFWGHLAIEGLAKLQTGSHEVAATKAPLGTGQTDLHARLLYALNLYDIARGEFIGGYKFRGKGEPGYMEAFSECDPNAEVCGSNEYAPRDEFYTDFRVDFQLGDRIVPGVRYRFMHDAGANKRNLHTVAPRLLIQASNDIDSFIEYERPIYGRFYPDLWPASLGYEYIAIGHELRAGVNMRFGGQ